MGELKSSNRIVVYIREILVGLLRENNSCSSLAERCGVSIQTISTWSKNEWVKNFK